MLNRKGLLLVVSGPSGAGKGTICKALLNKNDQIKLSVSATTRKPRNGEVHGVNYFFIEKEEFAKMIENGEFLEYAQIYDNFYGTPKAAIIECLEKGQDVILEIEMQGARQIKEVFTGSNNEHCNNNCCCCCYDNLIDNLFIDNFEFYFLDDCNPKCIYVEVKTQYIYSC